MRIAAALCIAAGLVAIGYLVWEVVDARNFQVREIARFSKAEPEPTPDEKPAPRDRDLGGGIALLSIPRVGLSALVVEGASERELRLAPGHVPGTALPGAGGNFAVAAHRDTFFRPLRMIRRDDSIVVVTRDREYHYRVASTTIVSPHDVFVLRPAEQEILTLITCYPFDHIGHAPQRFIVRADCIDCASAADARPPSALAPY